MTFITRLSNWFVVTVFLGTLSIVAHGASLTMGETAILGGGDSGNRNLLLAQQTTLSTSGTLQSLSFYVSAASGKLRLGLYDASGPNGGPGKKLSEAAGITAIAGWNTVSVTPINLAAGTYWLTYLASSNSLSFQGSSSGKFAYYRYAYASMPAVFKSSPSYGNGHWSFFGTLTTASTVAVPTPEPAPAPAPAPSPATDPITSTGGCALPNYPDATCTGVPSATALTVVNGDLVISTANAIVEGKDIRGCVSVTAPGVIIRNSKITCSTGYAVDTYGVTGAWLTIQDSTISCANHTGTTAIGEENVTVLRSDISGCENGFDTNKNMLIQDNYIHDLAQGSEAHTDGIQMWDTATNVVIVHNRMYSNEDGTSAIISPSNGTLGTVIRDNLFAGGAYSLYCRQNGPGGQHIINNHFSTIFYPTSGAYGPWTDCEDEAEVSGNVWHETGVLLPGQ